MGKDLVADHLVRKYDYKKRSIAQPLKESSRILFGLSRDQVDGVGKDLIDPRFGTTPRAILQHLGTDVLRKKYGEDFFIERLLNSLDEKTVISDVRFSNEVWRIRQAGGKIIKVIRPDVPRDQHSSESEIDRIQEFDWLLINDLTPEDLFEELDRLIDKEYSS